MAKMTVQCTGAPYINRLEKISLDIMFSRWKF